MSTKKRPATTGQPIATTSLSQAISMNSITKKEGKLQLLDYLIPLRSNDKQPWIKRPPYTWKRRFSYPDEFPDGCNYGFRLGLRTRSGIYPFGFDFDSSDIALFEAFLDVLRATETDITDTLIARSGGKNHGWHVYGHSDKPIRYEEFRYRGVHVEVLGAGHYVTIPPSKGENAPYKLVHPTLLHEYPADLDEFLAMIAWRPAFLPSDALTSIVKRFKEESNKIIEGQNQSSNLNSSTLIDSMGSSLLEESKLLRTTEESNDTHVALDENLCYQSLGFLPISFDLRLWKRLIKEAFQRQYGRGAELENLSSFLCPFHHESKPSVSLYLNRAKAKRMLHHFHPRGDERVHDFDVVEFFHAWNHDKEPAFLPGKSNAWLDAQLELFRYIGENNITTGFGRKFDKWNYELRRALIFPGGGDWKKYISDTLDAVIYVARPRVNIGQQFLASSYHIADIVGWNLKPIYKQSLVNRSMNFLVFSGILEKGHDYNAKAGKTYLYRFNYDITAEQLAARWEELNSKGLATFRAFKYKSIYHTYGKALADKVFRSREAERHEEWGTKT